MYHVIEDPHPGRCLSYRMNNPHGGGYAMRCLRMEGHEGSCRWPKEPITTLTGTAYGAMTSYAVSKPQPWVEPPETQ